MTSSRSGGGIGHAQIYAGDGKWFNAGTDTAIRRDNPYSSNAQARFLHAYRAP